MPDRPAPMETGPLRLDVHQAPELPDGVERLVGIGLGEGFTFCGRFAADWRSGRNRFDRPGELLVLARLGAAWVGFGGLNVDPYHGAAGVGRIRHVYVEPRARRRGVGGALVRELVRRAPPTFEVLRLRTRQAAPFYERLGFRPASGPHASHVLVLRPGVVD